MQRSRVLILVVSACALIALIAVVLWPQPRPAAASHITAVSAGGLHTCALTTSGGVQCWGRNIMGQLGDGTLVDSTIPVDVVGLEIGVTAVASGAVHTCAITTEGGVQCWGTIHSNSSTTAVPVVGLEAGVSAITGGWNNACALTTSGGVKCWGWNSLGQLGDGTKADRTTPVDVVGLDSRVAAVAAGGGHTCALTDSGAVKCWGHNEDGQLGNGEASLYPVLAPQDVVGLETGVAAIAAGFAHTCALLVTGGLKCWGQNFFGQVDNGPGGVGMEHVVPVDVPGLSSGVVAVSAGLVHTCALIDTGAAICWGANNFGNYGQTGDSDADGCTDLAEHGTNAAMGGRRDHLDYWDFFDVPTVSGRDSRVDGFDIGAVVLRFGTARGTPPTEEEALAEALTAPTDTTSYHAAFDRDTSDPEANLWNVRPPNGRIDGFDIGFVVVQFGHSCAVLP